MLGAGGPARGIIEYGPDCGESRAGGRLARGQGIGHVLVEMVLQWARAEGHHRVHLWVTETNHPARRLYQGCGFAVTGERKPLPSHPQYAQIAMARLT